MAFEDFLDAKRVVGVLGKRLARYGLTLHPDKTRFVDFRNNRPNGIDHPETNGTSFTFLGFTHIWGKSRAGKNVVRQVTAKNRYARALAAVTAWCRVNRHQPIPDQSAHLSAMMRGHYAYYGISGNFRRISWYAYQVARIWQKWLSRRDRGRRLLWDQFTALRKRHPLPAARIVHRYTFATAVTVTRLGLIGIGRSLAASPLPHHRAYGSVHGGSRSCANTRRTRMGDRAI
jgi:RNA-directed DNA polymerase